MIATKSKPGPRRLQERLLARGFNVGGEKHERLRPAAFRSAPARWWI